MKLKGIFALEIAILLIVVVFVLVFVQVTPYLASSKPLSKIDMYSQKTFVQGNVTLDAGQSFGAKFNYTSFDPVILVVDMSFKNWDKPGTLSLSFNGRRVGTFVATPNNPFVSFTVFSLSGKDWTNPPVVGSYTYGNEFTFSSPSAKGYMGSFSYQISIRGSR